MELLTYKDSSCECTYYVDSNGNQVLHGKHTAWYTSGRLYSGQLYSGQLYIRCFFVNGNRHGECKYWHENGRLWDHCFYVNSNPFPFMELRTEEEKTLFLIEHPDFRFIEE